MKSNVNLSEQEWWEFANGGGYGCGLSQGMNPQWWNSTVRVCQCYEALPKVDFFLDCDRLSLKCTDRMVWGGAFLSTENHVY